MDKTPPIGRITWCDLTVDDADNLKDFYAEVVGWTPSPVTMKDGNSDYCDYQMNAFESGDAVAGVCHGRGTNKGLPTAWIVYICVHDLDRSLATAERMGAEVLKSLEMGTTRYAILRDPAGAAFALYEESPSN